MPEKERIATEEPFPVSRLHFSKGQVIRNTTLSPRSRELKRASGEKPILSMLEKYGCMNRHMVELALKLNRHKTINAQKSLRRMQELRQISKYTIFDQDPLFPDNDVYVLSEAQRERLNITKAKRSIHDYNMANIPNVLETLALNQWHIRALHEPTVTEVMFNRAVFIRDREVRVPSLVRIKSRLKRPLTLCAVPIVRGRSKEAVMSFLAQVVFLNAFFAQNRRRFFTPVIVLIAESFRQAEDVSALLNFISETEHPYVLYAIDALLADVEVNPLQMLYQLRDEGNMKAFDIVKLA